ncbi:hypothetical protein HK100_006838 [Physocladia obscura]|uniref:C2H2-type domain-containing protein n=1 Tax=Physocladia obscura TaxID=109957 RepID=A0AAD5SVN6_9FUNG|nr:hypothetical protein HK100_006838 [Physocladia obscura]
MDDPQAVPVHCNELISQQQQSPQSPPAAPNSARFRPHLLRHGVNHSGVRNYVCDVPGCTATFFRSDTQLQHSKNHRRKLGMTQVARKPYHRKLAPKSISTTLSTANPDYTINVKISRRMEAGIGDEEPILHITQHKHRLHRLEWRNSETCRQTSQRLEFLGCQFSSEIPANNKKKGSPRFCDSSDNSSFQEIRCSNNSSGNGFESVSLTDLPSPTSESGSPSLSLLLQAAELHSCGDIEECYHDEASVVKMNVGFLVE